MAIVYPEYLVMVGLRQRRVLKPGGILLELGMQNWGGDVLLETLFKDTRATPDEIAKVTAIAEADKNSTKITDFYYRRALGCSGAESIDPGEAASTYKLDLNYAIPPKSPRNYYDIVTNSGTGEHVFDVCQFFENAHDLTKPGGLMMHAMPWSGWHDHGFYSFHPGFYLDLARANGYTLVDMAVGGVGCAFFVRLKDKKARTMFTAQLWVSGDNIVDLNGFKVQMQHITLCTVLRKGKTKQSFRIPTQRRYQASLKNPKTTPTRIDFLK
jgi:hypothetical protein